MGFLAVAPAHDAAPALGAISREEWRSVSRACAEFHGVGAVAHLLVELVALSVQSGQELDDVRIARIYGMRNPEREQVHIVAVVVLTQVFHGRGLLLQ